MTSRFPKPFAPTPRGAGLRALRVGAALAVTARLAIAQEPSKQECVDRHLAAQSQRLDGELVASLASLRTCASASCPEIVQRDCVAWLEELASEVPTVVFEAHDGAGPLRNVRVTQDGRALAEVMDGRAVTLDPGAYQFLFEAADGRQRSVPVLIRQGDHDRTVSADFTPPPERDSAWLLRVPPGARALGGVALFATATGAVLGVSALAQQSSALESCAPDCDDRVGRSVTTRAAIADAAAGVAIVTGAITLVWVGRASTAERRPATARVRPVLRASSRSAGVALRGEF
jgi:hypothetical protein